MRRAIASAVLASALFLAACSSDDGSSPLQVDAPGEAGGNSPSGDGTPSETGDDTPDAPDFGIPGGSDDIDDALGQLDGFLDSDCWEFSLAYLSLASTAFTGMFASEEDVAELQQQLADLDATVPDGIADEYAVVAEAFTEFADAVGDAGMMSPEFAEAAEILDDEDVVAAQDAIAAWLEAECSQFDEAG